MAVVGPGAASRDEVEGVAEAVGRGLAGGGAVVVCGGLGGVRRACRGAKEAGGMTVGILAGGDRAAANLRGCGAPDRLGEAATRCVVRAADALVAVAADTARCRRSRSP